MSHARRAKTRLRITHEAAKTEAGYVLREIDKLKLGIAPEKAAEEASTEKSLLHPLLQASAGDSKAPATPTEIVSAAEASSRAGDGGRTRDPRLGKPFSPTSSAFRPVQRVPSRRSSVGLAEASSDETERKGSVDEPRMLTDVLTARPRVPSAALLTVREVATLLRVSTATIYALAARQEPPHVRISNALRFRSEDVDGLLGRR